MCPELQYSKLVACSCCKYIYLPAPPHLLPPPLSGRVSPLSPRQGDHLPTITSLNDNHITWKHCCNHYLYLDSMGLTNGNGHDAFVGLTPPDGRESRHPRTHRHRTRHVVTHTGFPNRGQTCSTDPALSWFFITKESKEGTFTVIHHT
jgi:hypothetical protein